jgi:hypothetical protein
MIFIFPFLFFHLYFMLLDELLQGTSSSQLSHPDQNPPPSPVVTRSRSRRIGQEASNSDERGNVSDINLCQVCASHPRNTALIPCGHANLCRSCAEIFKKEKKCPTCRQGVKNILALFDN